MKTDFVMKCQWIMSQTNQYYLMIFIQHNYHILHPWKNGTCTVSWIQWNKYLLQAMMANVTKTLYLLHHQDYENSEEKNNAKH